MCVFVFVYLYIFICVLHYYDQCCEWNMSQMLSCVIRLPCNDKPFLNEKIHFIISKLSFEKLPEDYSCLLAIPNPDVSPSTESGSLHDSGTVVVSFPL